MKAALALLAPALALAACVPSASAPAPTPVPPPAARPAPARPAPVVPPVMQPPTEDSWMDAPATAGQWEYAAFPFGTQAIFRGSPGSGTGFSMSCNLADRRIMLLRLGAADAPRTMRILTETSSRIERADPVSEGFAGLTLRLDANDPLLDAMALSKGRFAVEVEGLAPLYLPSHAEVSRVIEDCRG